jgi:hypothetical protein
MWAAVEPFELTASSDADLWHKFRRQICQRVSMRVWSLYGMGLGPLKGPGNLCMLDALWCNLEPILRGDIWYKCPPPFKKLFHPLPLGLLPMVGHMVWSNTLQNMGFIIKVVKRPGEHLILGPPLSKMGWGGCGGHVPFTISRGRCKTVNDACEKPLWRGMRARLRARENFALRCSGMQYRANF